MYWQYVLAVLRKAVERMRGLTEVLLLILALALPGIAKIAGVNVPSDDMFAYLGVALVLLIFIRIFFVAPYQLWREQTGQVATLKLELAEPERREIAHMASIRAEKRLELAAALREFHWTSFSRTEDNIRSEINAAYGNLLRLMGQAGTPEGFTKLFARFSSECRKMNAARRVDRKSPEGKGSLGLLEHLVDYLHGRQTAEELSLKLSDFPEEPELPLEVAVNALAGQTTEPPPPAELSS